MTNRKYAEVPLVLVVAFPYLTVPFLPDFDYPNAPDSPPLAIIAASTATGGWDTSCPLYPRQRTFVSAGGMSEKCDKQT